MPQNSLPCGCSLNGFSSSGRPRVIMCIKHARMSEKMDYNKWIRFRDKIVEKIRALG